MNYRAYRYIIYRQNIRLSSLPLLRRSASSRRAFIVTVTERRNISTTRGIPASTDRGLDGGRRVVSEQRKKQGCETRERRDPFATEPANVFPDFADASRGPGGKNDRNGGGGERGGFDGEVRSGYRYGRAKREDGDSFFPFLSEEKSGSESVMESRHVFVVHTPAEPAAFPVTPSTNPRVTNSRDFLSFSLTVVPASAPRPAPAS